MKIEKIKKRLEEIDQNAVDTVKQTEEQIESLTNELSTISDNMEETYRIGDVEKGQQLAERKAIVESKIEFLKSFLIKRKSIPLLSEDEARKLKTDLNNELYSIYFELRKKADALYKEAEAIHETLNKAVSESLDVGNGIIRLSKSNEVFYQIDRKISALNGDLDQFTRKYRNYLNMCDSMKQN